MGGALSYRNMKAKKNIKKDASDSKHSIHRRDFIKGGAALSLGLASGALGVLNSCGQPPEKRNAIQLENAKPGTRDWQLTKTRQLPGKINPNLTNGPLPMD